MQSEQKARTLILEKRGRNINCLAKREVFSFYNGIHSQHLFVVTFMIDDMQVILKYFKQNLAIPVRLPAVHYQVAIHIPTIILQMSVPDEQH